MGMNWFVLALISSVTLSLRESFIKRNGRQVQPLFLSWAMNLIMFAFMTLMTVLTRNYFHITRDYLFVLILAAILDSVATVLYFSAIKGGDLSRTIPMLCFIPVVQVFVTPVLVHENLSLTGVTGVLVVVAGSYLLNMEKWDKIFSPFKVMLKEKSVLMMLAVALIWGVSSSFHKIGVKQTNALFWGFTEIGVICLILMPVTYFKEKEAFRGFDHLKKAVLPSVFSTLAVLSYYGAIGLGPVAYVSSVRRLGVLFSMMTGMIFFKEKLGPLTFAGGLIMIAGAVVITLFG